MFELAVGSDRPGVVHSVAPQRPANARRSRASVLGLLREQTLRPHAHLPSQGPRSRMRMRAAERSHQASAATPPPPTPPQASAQALGGRAQVSSLRAGLRWVRCRALTASPWSRGRVRGRRRDHLRDGRGGGGAAERRAGDAEESVGDARARGGVPGDWADGTWRGGRGLRGVGAGCGVEPAAGWDPDTRHCQWSRREEEGRPSSGCVVLSVRPREMGLPYHVLFTAGETEAHSCWRGHDWKPV